jgi:hypothetical protein
VAIRIIVEKNIFAFKTIAAILNILENYFVYSQKVRTILNSVHP